MPPPLPLHPSAQTLDGRNENIYVRARRKPAVSCDDSPSIIIYNCNLLINLWENSIVRYIVILLNYERILILPRRVFFLITFISSFFNLQTTFRPKSRFNRLLKIWFMVVNAV